MAELKYEDLTGKIIGAALRTHAILGNGFQEIIYQKALAIELELTGVNFQMEREMPIYYKGTRIGERRVDFLVENKICVELKAVVGLENLHLAQAKNYLEAFNLEVALLINFGAISLQFKRLRNNKYTINAFT
jgi:GxxExxY protein